MYTLDSFLFSEAVVVVDHKELPVEVVFELLAVKFSGYKTNNYSSADLF